MKFITIKRLNNVSSECASQAEVKNLIREDEISKKIFETRPIFNDLECLVKGSKALIEAFNSVDNVKIDYNAKFGNIKFSSYEKDSMIIEYYISERNLNVSMHTVYESEKKLLDKFSLTKYFLYCIKNNYGDIAEENFEKMLDLNKDSSVQLRTISHEDNILLRSVTSLHYKNYDNHIGLYLFLTASHDYAKRKNSSFVVKNGIISDSSILVDIMLESTIDIDNKTKINVGIRLNNNEISEGSLSIDFIYSVKGIDSEFRAVGDNVLNVVHTNRVETINRKLEGLNNLEKYTTNILDSIKIIKVNENLSSARIFEVFDRIIREDTFSKTLKGELRKLRDSTVNKTLTLIQLFNKIDDVIGDADVDERTLLQKLFHDYIKQKSGV